MRAVRHQKKTRRNAGREQAFIGGNVLSFLSGLSIGLLVAFIVFLRYQFVEPGAETGPGSPATVSRTPVERDKPEVEFTFYDTLRNKKINISEWVAGDKESGAETTVAEGLTQERSRENATEQQQYTALERDAEDEVTGYVLQAGSFKDFGSADKIKAQLALLGIFSDIQRVMLDEQDVRHRVRLGPYSSVDEMRDVRRKLSDNDIEFMLIELR